MSIWGKPCEEALAALDFADEKIDSYMTCKHYEQGSLNDVTLMCSGGIIDTVVVVWMTFDPAKARRKSRYTMTDARGERRIR